MWLVGNDNNCPDTAANIMLWYWLGSPLTADQPVHKYNVCILGGTFAFANVCMYLLGYSTLHL